MIINKDTLILVYYINTENCDGMADKAQFLDDIKEQVINEGCYSIVLPVEGENSRVECINPKYMSEFEYKKVEDNIKELDIKFKKFLSGIEDKTKY